MDRAVAGRIGFIGLGRMGRPMALRLVGGGFDVICHDTLATARAPLVAAGACAAGSVAEVGRGAGIVVTMLPDGQAVREVVLGEGGLAGAMADGGVIVDMSSSEPMGTRSLGGELANIGLSLVDAPVSGGVKKAEDGTLTIMAGGAEADIARARPALEAMGGRIFRTGDPGSGHAVKALNNFVSAAGLAASCEAALVARAFGIDPETLVDVLNSSTGRNNTTEVKMKPHILSGRFASGFAMALMEKDLGTAARLSEAVGRPMRGMAFQSALWSHALTELGPGADHTELFRFLDAGESAPPGHEGREE